VNPQRSLKARALQWLAQREHSRAELRRKLLAQLRADALAIAAAGDPLGDDAGDAPPVAAAAQVDAVLDWLEAHRYLSPERFIESRVHARAARYGNLRIRHELSQHELELPAEAAQALAQSELERALAVWARKFGSPAPDAAGRARQMRFLAGRGFSPGVIRQLLRDAAGAARPDPDAAEGTD
jgi:regulatory protein